MQLSLNEKQLLQTLLEERMLHNWDVCDRNHGTDAYERATDECYVIRHLAEKFKIEFPIKITERF